MSRAGTVLYIPPLGGQPAELLPEFWGGYDLGVEACPVDWRATDYLQRSLNISAQITELQNSGKVYLLGPSGAASFVLNLFAEQPDEINKVATVCGKINRLDRIRPHVFSQFPNFEISIGTLPTSLDKLNAEMLHRILCVFPVADEVVEPQDAVLVGAHEYGTQTEGHVASIEHALTVGSHAIADFFLS